MADTITGRAPTTPLDFYGIDNAKGVGIITHASRENVITSVKTLQIATNVNLETPGFLQSLNVTVTLGTSSRRGASCHAIYAKVNAGTAETAVSGRMAVIEARLEYGASTATQSTMSLLCLSFSNACTGGINNIRASYIALHDATTIADKMNTLFDMKDAVTSVDNPNSLIATTGALTQDRTIRCMLGDTPLYIMATTAVPTGG